MTAKTRALALLAGASLVVSNAPPPDIDTSPIPMFTYVRQVKQLFCGFSRGTGFFTGTNALTSANHVTGDGPCFTDDNNRIEVTYADVAKDYSSSRTVATETKPLGVDCRGFQEGREYIAVGFAHGATVQRTVVVSPDNPLTHPLMKWGDFTTLVGRERLIPGMSGGPIFDAETGEVVGIVRGYNTFPGISYARDVKDTPLCAYAVQ